MLENCLILMHVLYDHNYYFGASSKYNSRHQNKPQQIFGNNMSLKDFGITTRDYKTGALF
jgi:hypothetical protein